MHTVDAHRKRLTRAKRSKYLEGMITKERGNEGNREMIKNGWENGERVLLNGKRPVC